MRIRFVLLNLCLVALLGPAATVLAQTPDPTFDSDVVKLLELTGVKNLSTQLATLMARAITQQAQVTQPAAITIVADVVQTVVSSHTGGPEGLMIRLVPVYEKHFTHDEIRALLTFYQSEVGRKTVTVMPVALQEGAQIGQVWANELGPEIKSEIEKRFRAAGLIK